MELKESLEICLKMWRWIEHNSKDKIAGAPSDKQTYIDRVNTSLPHMDCDCACCEYAGFMDLNLCSEDACQDCPLGGLWGFWGNACEESGDSPFLLWKISISKKDRAKYAKIIADFAEAELKRLF